MARDVFERHEPCLRIFCLRTVSMVSYLDGTFCYLERGRSHALSIDFDGLRRLDVHVSRLYDKRAS